MFSYSFEKLFQKNLFLVGGYYLLKIKKNNFQITDVVEKPKVNEAKSNYAIIGRYILPKIIMSEIKKLKPGQSNEIHITDAIRNLIYKGNKFYGNIFKGKYLDCGTLKGYINSALKFQRRANEPYV